MITKLTNLARKFHRDNRGLEPLQVVMIIAIAAMILIAVATVSSGGVEWMTAYTSTLIGGDLEYFGILEETRGGVPVEELTSGTEGSEGESAGETSEDAADEPDGNTPTEE